MSKNFVFLEEDEVSMMKSLFICLTMLILFGWLYFKDIKISLASTHIFFCIYMSSFFHIMTEIIMIYGFNQLAFSSYYQINYLLFLFSLMIMMFLLYRYFLSFIEHFKDVSRYRKRIENIIFIVGMLVIALLPSEYFQKGYWVGIKTYALDIFLLFYMGLIIYYYFLYWRQIRKEKRTIILIFALIWVIASIAQIYYPMSLITPYISLFIILGFMLKVENQEQYIDQQTGLLNSYALSVVLDEWLSYQKTFYIGIITIEMFLYHSHIKKQSYYHELFDKINNQVKANFHQQCYKVTDNSFAFLTTSQQACQDLLSFLKYYCEVSLLRDDFQYKMIVVSEHQKKSHTIMSDIMNFSMDTVNKMAYVDFLTGAKNRNAFELELIECKKNQQYQYCFILDANNLKKINDTLGHSYGDEILQALVQVLSQLFVENGQIYRVGGDEFVVLCESQNKSIEEWQQIIILAIQQANQQRELHLDFAIGGSLLSESDFFKKADQNMYLYKRRRKQE